MRNDKLIADVMVATIRAHQFADVDDNGTCNFDTPWVFVETPLDKDDVREINDTIGCYEVEECCYAIGSRILSGQAYRRTKMAEEFVDCLRKLGHTAYVHYRID